MTSEEWRIAYQMARISRRAEWIMFEGRLKTITPICASQTLQKR